VTLLAFAAERRAAAAPGGRRDRSISPVYRALSSGLQRSTDGTDRRTDTVPLHRPCRVLLAVSTIGPLDYVPLDDTSVRSAVFAGHAHVSSIHTDTHTTLPRCIGNNSPYLMLRK